MLTNNVSNLSSKNSKHVQPKTTLCAFSLKILLNIKRQIVLNKSKTKILNGDFR